MLMSNLFSFSLIQKIKDWKQNRLQMLFFILVLFSLPFMVWQSKDAAISGDEFRYINQSEKVYNYFASKGKDKAAVTQAGIDPQHYNSQSFDVIVYTIRQKLNITDPFKFRHQVNTVTGWLTILFSALIALELLGTQAAIFTFLFLLFSPRFIGHSFNNHRDIPLALSFIFTAYYIIVLLKAYPKISYKKAILILIGIASAYSLRLAGGVLLSAFTVFFISIYPITEYGLKKMFKLNNIKILGKYTLTGFCIIIAGFFLGILIWPFGLEGPIKNSLEVFRASSSLGVSLNQLFEGKLINSATIPWYYTPKFILITTPIVVFVGITSYFLFHSVSKFRNWNRLQFIILFLAIIPLVYTTIKTKNDYGGWRHFLFVYPFFAIMAGMGFALVFKVVKNRFAKVAALIILLALTSFPLTFIIKNHPYQYVYFNELVGKVQKAYKTYESDYSCNGVLGGSKWIIENVIPELKEGEKIKITTNFDQGVTEYFKDFSNQVSIDYTRYYDKSNKDWDYAIFYCGYITPEQLKNGLWPPKGTVHTVDVDGFPIGAVVKRISFEDFKGFKALESRKLNEAKQHFRSFLKVYPESEQVLDAYARLMLTERKMDSALYYTDLALKYNPRQIGSFLTKASVYNTQKKYKEAIQASNEMMKIKETFAEGHYQKGFALKNTNKPNEALKEFQVAAANKKEYYMAYMQMGEILMNYKQYKKAQHIYKQILGFKKNDPFATIFSARCTHFLKDNKKALSLLESLPARQQNNLESVKVKCRIALNNNNMNAAGRYLNMARNINNNSDLFVVRALYLQKQNNKELCLKFLTKAKELDPNNREAQEIYKLINSQKTASSSVSKKETTSSKSIMFQKPKPQKTKGISIPVQ